MAKFGFAFSHSSNLIPPFIGVILGDLVRLESGQVVVRALVPVWQLSAVRIASGEIYVSGGEENSKFRYSSDGGISWVEDVSPSLINEPGEVIFEVIGTTMRTVTDGILASMGRSGQWSDQDAGTTLRWRDTDIWDDNTDQLFDRISVTTSNTTGYVVGSIEPLPDGGPVSYTLADTVGNMFAVSGSNIVLGTTAPLRGVYNLTVYASNVSGWTWSVPCRVLIL